MDPALIEDGTPVETVHSVGQDAVSRGLTVCAQVSKVVTDMPVETNLTWGRNGCERVPPRVGRGAMNIPFNDASENGVFCKQGNIMGDYFLRFLVQRKVG